MKKFLCLTVSALMLISFCGCLGKENVRGGISSVSQNTESDSFSLGETENNSYKNEFLGLSCSLPKEWIFYTDEQILELNNIVADSVDEEIAEAISNAKIIYDMYATNNNDGSSVNVNLEKISIAQAATLNLKQTIESQFPALKSGLENMGYTNVNIEYAKIKVGGKEFDGAKISGKIQGIDFYESVFTFKKGLYIANVTVATFSDNTDTILNYFTVL